MVVEWRLIDRRVFATRILFEAVAAGQPSRRPPRRRGAKTQPRHFSRLNTDLIVPVNKTLRTSPIYDSITINSINQPVTIDKLQPRGKPVFQEKRKSNLPATRIELITNTSKD